MNREGYMAFLLVTEHYMTVCAKNRRDEMHRYAPIMTMQVILQVAEQYNFRTSMATKYMKINYDEAKLRINYVNM